MSRCWDDWQVETSAWLALSLLVVVTVLLLFLFRLFDSLSVERHWFVGGQPQ